jgi:phosphoribosyl 1,2-cyclic phosphodiesterase
MITITPLASSSAGNCYIIDNGISRLLLDCGVPWRKVLQDLGHRLDNVAGCLVTHEHGDHSIGVTKAAGAGIDIYLSHGTAEVMGCFGHRFHRLYPLVNRPIDGGWLIFPFVVEHDAAEPLGFVVTSGSDRLLYLTDTAYCRYLFPGVTHAIIECNYDDDTLDRNVEIGFVDIALAFRIRRSHLSLQRVIDLIQRNEWTGLQEVHLIHLSSANSDAVLFKTEVQKITGCPVYVAGE